MLIKILEIINRFKVGNVIEKIHDLISLSFIIPFIVNNKKILTYYLYFLIFVYVGWIVFNNNCWLTLVESKLLNKKSDYLFKNSLNIIKKLFLKFNITISNKIAKNIYWSLNYLSVLVVTYKLNLLPVGILWIFIFIIYEKILNYFSAKKIAEPTL